MGVPGKVRPMEVRRFMVSCGVHSFIIEEFCGVIDSSFRLGDGTVYSSQYFCVFKSVGGIYTNDYRGGFFLLLMNYTKVIVKEYS